MDIGLQIFSQIIWKMMFISIAHQEVGFGDNVFHLKAMNIY